MTNQTFNKLSNMKMRFLKMVYTNVGNKLGNFPNAITLTVISNVIVSSTFSQVPAQTPTVKAYTSSKGFIFDNALMEQLKSNGIIGIKLFTSLHISVECDKEYYNLIPHQCSGIVLADFNSDIEALLRSRPNIHNYNFTCDDNNIDSASKIISYTTNNSSGNDIQCEVDCTMSINSFFRMFLQMRVNPEAICFAHQKSINNAFAAIYVKGPHYIATASNNSPSSDDFDKMFTIFDVHFKKGSNPRQRDIPGFEQEMIDAGFEEYL